MNSECLYYIYIGFIDWIDGLFNCEALFLNCWFCTTKSKEIYLYLLVIHYCNCLVNCARFKFIEAKNYISLVTCLRNYDNFKSEPTKEFMKSFEVHSDIENLSCSFIRLCLNLTMLGRHFVWGGAEYLSAWPKRDSKNSI